MSIYDHWKYNLPIKTNGHSCLGHIRWFVQKRDKFLRGTCFKMVHVNTHQLNHALHVQIQWLWSLMALIDQIPGGCIENDNTSTANGRNTVL